MLVTPSNLSIYYHTTLLFFTSPSLPCLVPTDRAPLDPLTPSPVALPFYPFFVCYPGSTPLSVKALVKCTYTYIFIALSLSFTQTPLTVLRYSNKYLLGTHQDVDRPGCCIVLILPSLSLLVPLSLSLLVIVSVCDCRPVVSDD